MTSMGQGYKTNFLLVSRVQGHKITLVVFHGGQGHEATFGVNSVTSLVNVFLLLAHFSMPLKLFAGRFALC